MLYYAHSLEIYSTHAESYEIFLIDEYFNYPIIWNPSIAILAKDYSSEEEIMEKCFSVIRQPNCDALVFSTRNGIIGKGVSQEVTLAKELGKPIYVINGRNIERVHDFKITPLGFSNRIYATIEAE